MKAKLQQIDWNLFKRINKQFLSFLIEKERRKFRPIGKPYFSKRILSELYIPSLRAFFVSLIFPAIFFILAHFGPIPKGCFGRLNFQDILSYQQSNQYQNLIAIHAGIGVIIFALIIFIAESLRDDETKDRARVLLKESYLFPLAVSEILVFFIFIWGDVNFWSIFPVLGIGLFTIWSLGRIIAVLLSRYRFALKRAEILKERLQMSIDLAINERLGNNILLQKLDGKEIKLEFHPFSIDEKSEYHCFSADKFGIISDLHLEKLKEFADLLDEEAKKNGFSFEEKTEGMPIELTSGGEIISQMQRKPLVKNRKRYLLKKYHDRVEKEYNALICFDKTLVKGEEALARLEKLFEKIFTIRKSDNFAEEVRYEISGLKDQMITAITNKQLGKVEELTKLYVDLAEGFLEQIIRFGGVYSFEQAQKERHSLFAGWQEIRWLSSDIREIFIKAMESHDGEIMKNVAYLPILIARRAINYKDHYLFQEFIRFVELLYIYAFKEVDRDLKELMIDRSWRYIKEISEFHIEYKLKKEDINSGEIKTLKDFAIHVFFVFQNLLKRAFDNRDQENFTKYVNTVQRLYEHFEPSKSLQNSEHLKWRLAKEDLSIEQRNNLEQAIKRQDILESAEKEILARREQMLFGLASWIFDQFSLKRSEGKIKLLYNLIQEVLPGDLVELTRWFLSTHSFDVEDFWGWSWWELKMEGEAQWLQPLEKLERLYVVKALSNLESKTDPEIQGIILPHSRDLAYLVEGTRDLMKTLDDITKNPENWKFVISEAAISKTSLLRALLKRAKEEQERKELEFKRTNPISQRKVEAFKNDVLRGFNESTVVRNIFTHYKLYENRVSEPYHIKEDRFGINTVDDKAAFFEEWYVHFGEWGVHYGENLASSENSYLLGEIAKNCAEIKEGQFEEQLIKFEELSSVLIFATNMAIWRFFEKSKYFTPKWHKDTRQLDVEGFNGWYEFNGELIPIFETFYMRTDKQILILNRSKLGKLIQYSPLNKGESEQFLKDIFYMNVQAFSENNDLLDGIIKKPPDWLREIGDEERQREYLQERVLIHVFERFEYNKDNDFEGYKLNLSD